MHLSFRTGHVSTWAAVILVKGAHFSPPMAAAPQIGFADTVRVEMIALFEGARRFDIRHFEELSAAEVVQGLSLPVQALVRRTVALATRLLEHYDRPEAEAVATDPSLHFELAMDSVLAEQNAGSKVADLAFMAVTELRQRLGRLVQHHPAGDGWEMLCDASSALRRVQKSVTALEAALCEAEQLPRELRYDSELQTSLEVRRQYRKLWRFVAREGEVRPEGVRNALRGAGTLLAMLVGRDVYTRLRESDRFHLRQQQRRILSWLVQESPDAKAGVRIWQDFAGMVEMFRQVNLRQDLVAHDTATLREVEAALASGDFASLERARAALASLQGLDDDLDELVAEQAPPERVLEAARRVAARFTAASSAGGAF